MDQKFNTTFIPKKFLSEDVSSGSSSKYIKRRSVVGPGYFISVLLFVAAVGASIALFGYTKLTEKSIAEKIALLEEQMKEVKSEDLVEFLDLERQLRSAKALLGNHVAVSEVLHKFEEITLRDIRYQALTYQGVPGGEVSTVDLSGAARTLSDIALQVRQLETDKMLSPSEVTRLDRDPILGFRLFDVQTGVLKNLISYDVAIREGRHGKSPVPGLATQPNTVPTPVSTSTPL